MTDENLTQPLSVELVNPDLPSELKTVDLLNEQVRLLRELTGIVAELNIQLENRRMQIDAVRMSFLNMIGFIFKWFFASLVVIFILAAIYFGVMFVLSALGIIRFPLFYPRF